MISPEADRLTHVFMNSGVLELPETDMVIDLELGDVTVVVQGWQKKRQFLEALIDKKLLEEPHVWDVRPLDRDENEEIIKVEFEPEELRLRYRGGENKEGRWTMHFIDPRQQ